MSGTRSKIDADKHGTDRRNQQSAITSESGAVYAELPEPTASIGIDDAWHEPAMRDFADRTHALRMQAAPKAAPGDVLDEAMRERDDAEDFIDALLDEVLGHERPEWSSSYGRADALNDVQERMTALHKPAVDKAWGRFQSAITSESGTPQQEAQEPWGYARKTPGCGWHLCSKRHHEEAVADGDETKKLYATPPASTCRAGATSGAHQSHGLGR